MPKLVQITAAALAALLIPLSAAAQTKAPEPARSGALEALAACRGVADPGRRLACYDEAAEALEAAEKSGDVVVVDRAQIREAKRQAFGFSIPSLQLFERGEKAEAPPERITTTLVRAWTDSNTGQMAFELEEGAVWRTLSRESLYPNPKKGDAVEVYTGALGSFFLKVGKSKPVRVRRER